MSEKKFSLFIPVAILILAVIAALGFRLYQDMQAKSAANQRRELAALKFYPFKEPRPLNNTSLDNLQGLSKPVTQHMEGWRLVNFGYMYCPDICPLNLASLNTLKTAWDELDNGTSLDVLHITFDPARDTPELLSQYLNHFNPSFYGLTGNLDNIRKVAQQLHMVFIHEKPDENGHYFISHSDSIALLNPQGQYVGSFKGPYNTDNMIKALQRVTSKG